MGKTDERMLCAHPFIRFDYPLSARGGLPTNRKSADKLILQPHRARACQARLLQTGGRNLDKLPRHQPALAFDDSNGSGTKELPATHHTATERDAVRGKESD